MTEKWDLRPIYDVLIAYDHRFALKEAYVPRMWIKDGCDMQLDIVPTIEGIIAWAKRKGRTIGGFEYFTKPIMEARDRRLQKETTKPAPQEDKDRRRAESIAWCRDRGIQPVGLSPRDFDWLSEYEAKHGRVAI